MTDKQFNELNAQLDGRVEKDIPLAPLTWFKIGGSAKAFFIAKNNSDLIMAVLTAKKLKIHFWVFSGGSNLLINSAGLDKFVIQHTANEILYKSPNIIIADAGAVLMDVVNISIEKGLDGLVWASGIPGSLGGAVRGNAGAYGGEMRDVVSAVEVLRGNRQMIIKRDKLDFSYRHSMFKTNSDIILSVELTLNNMAKSTDLKLKSAEIIIDRASKHPSMASAGSYFKNILINYENKNIFEKLNIPEKFWGYGKVSSGWVIDQLELRGTQIGGAKISDEHANIIINTGTATSDDVLQLASLIKTGVRDKFNIQLEEEVQLIN